MHKANFTILAGFLTELLKFEVSFENVLESEGNKEGVDNNKTALSSKLAATRKFRLK